MQLLMSLSAWPALLAQATPPVPTPAPAGDADKAEVMWTQVIKGVLADPRVSGWEWVFVGLFLAFIALMAFLYTTRSGVIARATTKEAVRQPVFLLLMILGIKLLVLNTFVPVYSLGDDVKMLKDCGLATVLIAGVLLALWTASTSIADEIEGKTAMTLLSKPINRRQFITGKYLGILTAVLILLTPLTLCLLGLIDYKVFYDAKESSIPNVKQAQALGHVIQAIPGVVLSFFEIATLAAVSVAISTRVPMAVNMVTCMSIFIVGHLTPALVAAGANAPKGLELVLFFARVIASVLPALQVFKIDEHIATDTLTPAIYVAWSALYSVVYSLMALLLAFFLFEDRDLA